MPAILPRAALTLTPASSVLLLIDVQERFLPVMPMIDGEAPVGRNCRILLSAARLLGVPTLISEQVPAKLGSTLAPLAAAAPEAPRLPKQHFSCVDDAAIAAQLTAWHPHSVVVAGIEAHVCVLHTVADLITRGRQVVVAGDAIASRHASSLALALDALRDVGALVLPSESIVLRWQRVAEGPTFKAIAALVK